MTSDPFDLGGEITHTHKPSDRPSTERARELAGTLSIRGFRPDEAEEAVNVMLALASALEDAEWGKDLANTCIDALEVALFGDLEGRSRDTLEAKAADVVKRAEDAEREALSQMQAKLDAQATLSVIVQALDLRLADLGNGWKEATTPILARVEAIVDEGERGFRERDEAVKRAEDAERENERLRETLREAVIAAVVPLEVLAAQIALSPYQELSLEIQSEIVEAVTVLRRAALTERNENAPSDPG